MITRIPLEEDIRIREAAYEKNLKKCSGCQNRDLLVSSGVVKITVSTAKPGVADRQEGRWY